MEANEEVRDIHDAADAHQRRHTWERDLLDFFHRTAAELKPHSHHGGSENGALADLTSNFSTETAS